MLIATTERLMLRQLEPGDAAFICELLNDPDWLRYIGDRGVRSVEAAREYINNVYLPMYARLGFGLWVVDLRDEGIPIGICGLVQRDWLDAMDIGFAFLPGHRGRGLAGEAAAATLDYAANTLGFERLLAIVTPNNASSRALLARLGFELQRITENDAEEAGVCIYARELSR